MAYDEFVRRAIYTTRRDETRRARGVATKDTAACTAKFPLPDSFPHTNEYRHTSMPSSQQYRGQHLDFRVRFCFIPAPVFSEYNTTL